jgi:DNA-binding NtrC family response regulator
MGASDRPEAAPLRSARFLQGLMRHAWPGNVRELKNYLERCLAVQSDLPPVPEVNPAVPPPIDFDEPFVEVRDRWLRHVERRYVEELLRRHEGNVTAAARAARMDRVQFYRVMARCGITRGERS